MFSSSIPSLLLLLLLAAPALLTPSTSQELEVRGQRAPRDTKQDAIKVVISEGCATQGDSSGVGNEGREIDLSPGSPLVLTHKIKLVPSGSGPGSGSCGCEKDFAALRERLERLEKEVSALREKCGGADGGCCTSKESKGAGCSITPEIPGCPSDCSDQGRCVDGKCVCFSGFSGPDCSESDCPGNCNDKGRCVNGKCVCDPGFSEPDCAKRTCPDNCSNRGRCVNGKCVCDGGFTGPDCSLRGCPDNCNNRGRCVNGKCVCDSGFMGRSCSDEACPGNCNNRGRCVRGKCVCSAGFSGPDCSKQACPANCNNRGRCVNGQCVCDGGFTGADCSEVTCPANCNSRGRCVNGECVCDEGFGGPDCSERICPNDCYDRGRCVDGTCVCDSGFTGDDCSETACPGNCNNRGRCVNGQCVCSDGFTGADCSEKSCPNNCNNRGKCVNGKCVCDVGFAGPDCAAKGCPGNCNNKGRCIKGKCVCRRGFTGPDCSQCEDRMTGPNCDTVMSGVSQLSPRDVTETSVTLVWTPPPVQYETYHITFSSKKESDQQISVQVEGSLTTFTQTGLAAGQEYTVSVTGEIDGRRGAESSTEFTTLISGPTNLHVVKTTSTTAVVQWQQSQGEIDRYHLTVTPSDGVGRSQEMTVPAGQNSAHIQQLEAGRLYDITLVAEKGPSQSKPSATQVTPGKTLPGVTTAALNIQVPEAPEQGADDRNQESEPSPEVQVFDQQEKKEDGTRVDAVREGGIDEPNKDSTASVVARTKPLDSRKKAADGTRPKLAEKTPLPKKPNFRPPLRSNTTRVPPGVRKVGPGPLKKPPVGEKKKNLPIVPKKPKPGLPKRTIQDDRGNRTVALTGRDPSDPISNTERRVAKTPAKMSRTDPDANRQIFSEEPTVADESKERPDAGIAGRENDTSPVSSKPVGIGQSQEKKCMNKIKVTHIRFPHKDNGKGCRGDGTVIVGRTPGLHKGPSETVDIPDLKILSAETDLDSSADPLHKLLRDTYDNLNVTTFSVHLSDPPVPSVDSGGVREPSSSGLKPLISSASSSTSQSSSQTSAAQSSLPSSSTASPSLTSSPSTTSSTRLVSSSSSALPLPSSSPSPVPSSPSSSASSPSSSASSSSSSSPSSSASSPSSSASSPSSSASSSSSSSSSAPSSAPSSLPSNPSSSHSISDKSSPGESSEPDHSKSMTAVASGEDRKGPPLRKDGQPFFRRTPAKPGYVRRPRPNFGSFQNRTNLNLRPAYHSPPHSNLIPGRETETRETSTSELVSPPSSSASEESTSVEVKVPLKDTSRYEGEAASPASSEAEKNEKKIPTEKGKLPVRRLPIKAGYPRRLPPNFGRLQNQTRPNLKLLRPPSKPLSPVLETRKEPVTEWPTTSSPPVNEPHPTEGAGPQGKENEDIVGTNMSVKVNQNLRGSGLPFPRQPATKIGLNRQLYGGRFPNKTRAYLRPPQNPNRGPVQKPSTIRKPNEGNAITGGDQTSHLERVRTPETPDNQFVEQVSPTPAQGVPMRQPGEKDTAEAMPSAQINGHDTIKPQTSNNFDGRGKPPVQTTRTREKETINPDYNPNSDILKERVNTGRNTGAISRSRPTVKETVSDSRHGAPRPVTPPERRPPIKRTQMRNNIPGNQRQDGPMRNNTAKRLLDSKTEKTKPSKPPTGSDASSSGVTREPLDYVGVTNRTRDGFTLTWDSPEGKYKNFVVTSKEVEKDEGPKQKTNKKNLEDKEDVERDGVTVNHQPSEDTEPENGSSVDENRIPESVFREASSIQSSTTAEPPTGSDKTFKTVLPGSARSFQFENLPPQSEYTVTLLGKGPGLLSRLHKLVISTGPEPPTNIVFSKVTENSLTVSWTKPTTPISGFKVTYTHTDEGEPVSVSVDSGDSTLGLSKLSPGSTYEVSVISVLGLDESDPIRDFVMTLPDAPTDLRAVNVTENKALLLWRPALAAVDKYTIVYGAETGSALTVTVSGNAAEQQLSGLEGSTTYTVTITSQLGSVESPPTTTSFTTAGESGDGSHDLQARDVTPRTALLSWKPPSSPVGSYRLTYQTEGQDMKEVIVDASVTEFNLTRLHPGSKYTVQLQAEEGGRYSAASSTEFTTGTLRFPFPTDCSQELLNGIRTSGEAEIFPQGKLGTPLMVYCDMETDGGGWTVFQRRKDGSVNFFRSWKDYVQGFGNLSGEFWLGLDSLHNLTTRTRMSLRIDLRDKDESVFAKYSTFEVAKRNYRLTVGGYSGTAGDSLSYHNNRVFSTRDRDPAPFITRCAMSYRGGWWYKNCHEANLNGLYGIDVKHQGLIWTSWKGKEYSIAFTEMKMRPASFRPPA